MKENNENEKEIKEEKKEMNSLKDNIKEDNLSDINIKNQSIHNNENEEIKILIDDNKNKKEDIIKKVNKIPGVRPNYEFQFNDTMKKIKNKSLEKKMKDLFDSNSNKKNENINNNNGNKFMDKLKEIELKINEIEEYKLKKKSDFKFNLNKKNNNEEKNNRYENFNKYKYKENNINNMNNKNKNFFDFNFSTTFRDKTKENKYKNLKKWYFSSDKFKFYNSPLDMNTKKNQILNYYDEMKKTFRKYNAHRMRRLNNRLRETNIPDNFKNILDKVDKFKRDHKENKIIKNNLSNNKLSISDIIRNKSKNNNLKTISMEKPTKLKNIIEDIYSEINNANTISSKKNFSKKLFNLKSKMMIYSLGERDNIDTIIKSNNIMGRNRFTQSSFSNLDDLLKLCSKRNLKKYAYNF